MIPASPRHFPEDPPGYSPIVWLHDVAVPPIPPYVSGSFKKVSDIDPAKISPRDTATTVWTEELPDRWRRLEVRDRRRVRRLRA